MPDKELPGSDPSEPEVTVETHEKDSVEVDLDKKESTQEQDEAKELAKEMAQQQERLQAAERQIAAQRRINERLAKEKQEYEDRIRAAQTMPSAPPTPADELDQLVEKDWKSAVGRIAEERAQKYYEQRRAEEERQRSYNETVVRLEQSKNRVIERYPDLDPNLGNEESPVSLLYNEVLNADPTILRNEYGPEVAMYRMEQLARERGLKLDNTPSPRGRGGAGSLPPSRGAGQSSGKFVLTREQKEYCDLHNISYESYARMARTTEETGGVEV